MKLCNCKLQSFVISLRRTSPTRPVKCCSEFRRGRLRSRNCLIRRPFLQFLSISLAKVELWAGFLDPLFKGSAVHVSWPADQAISWYALTKKWKPRRAVHSRSSQLFVRCSFKKDKHLDVSESGAESQEDNFVIVHRQGENQLRWIALSLFY